MCVCLSVCLSVCLLVTFLSPVQMAEPIEMLFSWLTLVGPRKYVLDGGQGRTNPFAAARGDKTAMWPFVKMTIIFTIKCSQRF